MITRPALLLLDEPFSALDPRTGRKISEKLTELRRELHCAVVFVTHNFREAEELSERIGILAGGRLCGVVPKDELYSSPWPPEAAALLGIEEKT